MYETRTKKKNKKKDNKNEAVVSFSLTIKRTGKEKVLKRKYMRIIWKEAMSYVLAKTGS